VIRKIGFAALAAVMLTGSVMAAELPPGKWWQRPEIAQRLGLSPEQQDRLDAIFRSAAEELIDRRGDVEKAGLALRGELDQQQPNRQSVLKAAARLSDVRGRLFQRELEMLMDMRAVLNDGQWNRLRAFLDRQADQQRPPMQRRRP
jgi:hypothetical protein